MGIPMYGNDYLVKSGNGSRNSSGPSGRRKMRANRIMVAALADAASHGTIVVWCSDSHKNLGTGVPPKVRIPRPPVNLLGHIEP
jgi:hypothetical protein